MHLALGETDSWAHLDNYYQHLNHLHLADSIIKHLYQTINPDFIVIVTDHGRGNGKQWISHGPDIKKSGESWCIVISSGRFPDRVKQMIPTRLSGVAGFIRDLLDMKRSIS